ncbi:MAG: YdbH domain-containing protein, partial [Hyphomonadaceae bacterium]
MDEGAHPAHPPPEADEPPRARPRRRGAVVWSVLGLGVFAAMGATGWTYRVPIAGGLIRSQLAAGGIDSDFEIERLDFGGAAISGLRLGPANVPDAMANRAEVLFGWNGIFPGIDVIRLIEPRLRARVSEAGFSLGSLDSFTQGPPGRRGALPRWRVEVIGGEALVQTPFGALPATFTTEGRLRENFVGSLVVENAARQAGDDFIRGANLNVTARSTAEGVRADLTFTAAAFSRNGASGENLAAAARLDAPSDLTRASLTANWRAEELTAAGVTMEALTGAARLSGALQSTSIAFNEWTGAARAGADALAVGDARIEAARLEASLTGNAERGQGNWTLTSDQASTRDWRAANVQGQGQARLRLGETIDADLTGVLQSQHASMTPGGREGLRRAWPELGGLPLGPLFTGARNAALAGLADFRFRAPFIYALRENVSSLALNETLEARGASGARVRLAPRNVNGPAFFWNVGTGQMAGAARVELSGGGLPDASWTIDQIRGGGREPIIAEGALVISDWRALNARLAAPEARASLSFEGARGNLRLIGPVTLSGPAGAGSVRDLSAPLDLNVAWGDGVRVASQDRGCIPARFAGLTLPGLNLSNGALSLCPEGESFFAIDAQNRVSGGFNLARLSLGGHLEGNAAQRTTIAAERIAGRFSGTASATILDVVATSPRMNVLMAPGRMIAINGARLTARSVAANGTWSAEGVFENGDIADPAIAANMRGIAMRWTAAPRGNDALLHVADGRMRLTERAPPDAGDDHIRAFEPLLVENVTGDLLGGRLTAHGDVLLEAGRRQLGVFEATHELESAAGQAQVRIRDLNFHPRLQPYMISELSRGVAENVRGPLEADIDVAWTPAAMTARARVAITDLSLSSATLPLIEGLTGEIVFDDLFTLSTPPGQVLHVARLNPGIEVTNGTITFQLLSDGRVSLEGAHWPFAGGALDVRPTTLTLGAEETRFILTMSDVDVHQFLERLNVPDLTATGRVEGTFPLLLTSTTALIENGSLATAPGGGTIAYTGDAGRNAEGVAGLAFDALTRFHYDNLALVLNGDLGGDVITTIVFSGRNDAALNMGAVTPGGVPTFGGSDIP